MQKTQKAHSGVLDWKKSAVGIRNIEWSTTWWHFRKLLPWDQKQKWTVV